MIEAHRQGGDGLDRPTDGLLDDARDLGGAQGDGSQRRRDADIGAGLGAHGPGGVLDRGALCVADGALGLDRGDAHGALGSVALDDDLGGAGTAGGDPGLKLLPGGDLHPAPGDDPVADLDAGGAGGADRVGVLAGGARVDVGRDTGGHGRQRRRASGDPDHADGHGQQHDPQDQVGEDSPGHDDELLGDAEVVEGPMLLAGLDLLQGLGARLAHHAQASVLASAVRPAGPGRWQHADELDVAAQPDGLDAVFGLPALERPDLGAEADEVLGYLHAELLGGDHVPELVKGH